MNIKSTLLKPLRNSRGLKKLADPILESTKILDGKLKTPYEERFRFKQFLEAVKNDTTALGKGFQEEFAKTRALSFVNQIASIAEKRKPQVSDYRNLAEEINSRFEVKAVEAAKTSKRVGLLGFKMGMTGVWDKFGTNFPLTVIKVDNCQVTQVKSPPTDKYASLQVGMGDIDPKSLTKPRIGHLIKNNLPPKRHLREFRVSPENLLPVGFMLSVRHLVPGQLVDVIAHSKGKGWEGVMWRWNFKGGVASHGNSKKHRAGGSIGNREKPGKVWKNKKMPGQLGNERTTCLNLIVYKIDYAKNLVFLKGSVPGRCNGLIMIRDAVKRHEIQFGKLLFPTFVPQPGKVYADPAEWDGTEDLNEKYSHDNDEVLGVSEEEEEGEPEVNADEDMMIKK